MRFTGSEIVNGFQIQSTLLHCFWSWQTAVVFSAQLYTLGIAVNHVANVLLG